MLNFLKDQFKNDKKSYIDIIAFGKMMKNYDVCCTF